MWVFEQFTGRMVHEGEIVTVGYAGHADGKNNPMLQQVEDVGPIPQGWYTIEAPRDTPRHGPYVMPLVPDAGNDMFGRAGFLIHGDRIGAPGTASEGCIVVDPETRHRIWLSGDRRLQVVSGIPQPDPPRLA